MRNIVDTLKAERESILAERSRLAAEIEKLQAEQSSLKQKLFHMEKLMISYGAKLDESMVTALTEASPTKDSKSSETDKKVSRPSLLPEFNGCSLIEAINKVLSNEPDKVFDPAILIDFIFVLDRTHEQYSIAKRSLTAELSRGAKENRWYKIPKKRGKYRFNQGDIELEQSHEYRSPRELKRPQFQGSGYINACTQLLTQNPQGMSLEDLASAIFVSGSDIENEKAETSLSVELNRAVRENRLHKVADSDFYCLVEATRGNEAQTEKASQEANENAD